MISSSARFRVATAYRPLQSFPAPLLHFVTLFLNVLFVSSLSLSLFLSHTLTLSVPPFLFRPLSHSTTDIPKQRSWERLFLFYNLLYSLPIRLQPYVPTHTFGISASNHPLSHHHQIGWSFFSPLDSKTSLLWYAKATKSDFYWK